MFDRSVKAGGRPFEVDNVGSAQVISGWNLGLIGMKPGGARRLTVPSAVGDGTAGAPPGGNPPHPPLGLGFTLPRTKEEAAKPRPPGSPFAQRRGPPPPGTP